MKLSKQISLFGLLIASASTCYADIKNFDPEKKLSKNEVKKKLVDRKVQSKKLSDEQDELSADVQELTEAQTDPKVIMLLEEVEELMAGVTDNLAEAKTGKKTIGNETLIIEKIFEAAKQKAKGQGQSGEQLQKQLQDAQKSMEGNGKQQEGKPGGNGDKPGDNAGMGADGQNSGKANDKFSGNNSKNGASRKLPKKGGISPSSYPSEYRKVIEAYGKKKSSK